MRNSAWLLATLAMLGCAAPLPNPDPAPHDLPSAAQQTGRATVAAVSGPTKPFIVDWQPEERGDLEEAMTGGVVVVAFDAQSLRLLRDCRLSGQYGYVGITTKYQVVRFESADEVQANLPLGGLGLAAEIGGGFQNGTTLDLALAMVGKKRTTWNEVTRADLSGDCRGATHFVRGATIGAFVLEPGRRSEARVAAQILGAGAKASSASSRKVTTSDGDLDACKRAAPDKQAPPSQCSALLRLELEPISQKAKTASASASASAKQAESADASTRQASADRTPECPAGMVFDGEKCAQPAHVTHRVCRANDAADCREQCQRGNAVSCDIFGVMLARGEGIARDDAQAAEAFKRACQGGSANACSNLGILAMHAGRPDLSAPLFERSCRDGNATGCEALGELYYHGNGVTKSDRTALKWFSAACDAGNQIGCTNVGFLYGGASMEIPKDEVKGVSYAARACDGGVSTACGNLGLKYEFGVVVGKSPARAVALFERACRLEPADCLRLAIAQQAGFGVPANLKTAHAHYTQSCKALQNGTGTRNFAALGCVMLNALYGERHNVPRDALQGVIPTMEPQCNQDVPRACTFLALAHFGLGQTASGQAFLDTGCKMQDYFACDLKRRQPKP